LSKVAKYCKKIDKKLSEKLSKILKRVGEEGEGGEGDL
jgi:hypothetical protein